MPIFVDGDACPVKDEVYRVARRYAIQVFVVSNALLHVPPDDLVEGVVVRGGFDAVDDWIAEHIGAEDVAITADIPLAERRLRRGARVLGPKGQAFTEDAIGEALATRASWTCCGSAASGVAARPPSPRRIGRGSSRSSTRPSTRSAAAGGSNVAAHPVCGRLRQDRSCPRAPCRSGTAPSAIVTPRSSGSGRHTRPHGRGGDSRVRSQQGPEGERRWHVLVRTS